MRKVLFIWFILFLFQSYSYAQIKVGLRFAPDIATNRLVNNVSNVNYDLNGVGLKFTAGPVIDYFFRDNYAFSTGLWYSVKRSGLTSNLMDKNARTNLQYIQLPLSMKFYTNELAQLFQLYFQVGGTMDFKIAEKHKEYKVNPGKLYSFFDVGLLFSTGAQWSLGDETKIFTGIVYNRGLINIIKDKNLNNELKVYNTLIGIEVGLMF